MAVGATTGARPIKVLVVEDNIINQRLATNLLKQLGHTGVVVADGEKALRALAALRFDAVLLDVMMPVLDGMQTLLAIRQEELRTGKHVPVIMATAHDDPADRRRFLSAGADGYLSKPLNVENLQGEIFRLFSL